MEAGPSSQRDQVLAESSSSSSGPGPFEAQPINFSLNSVASLTPAQLALAWIVPHGDYKRNQHNLELKSRWKDARARAQERGQVGRITIEAGEDGQWKGFEAIDLDWEIPRNLDNLNSERLAALLFHPNFEIEFGPIAQRVFAQRRAIALGHGPSASHAPPPSANPVEPRPAYYPTRQLPPVRYSQVAANRWLNIARHPNFRDPNDEARPVECTTSSRNKPRFNRSPSPQGREFARGKSVLSKWRLTAEEKRARKEDYRINWRREKPAEERRALIEGDLNNLDEEEDELFDDDQEDEEIEDSSDDEPLIVSAAPAPAGPVLAAPLVRHYVPKPVATAPTEQLLQSGSAWGGAGQAFVLPPPNRPPPSQSMTAFSPQHFAQTSTTHSYPTPQSDVAPDSRFNHSGGGAHVHPSRLQAIQGQASPAGPFAGPSPPMVAAPWLPEPQEDWDPTSAANQLPLEPTTDPRRRAKAPEEHQQSHAVPPPVVAAPAPPGRSDAPVQFEPAEVDFSPQGAVVHLITRRWHVAKIDYVNKTLTTPQLVELLRGGPNKPLPAPIAFRVGYDELQHYVVTVAYETVEAIEQARAGLHRQTSLWGHVARRLIFTIRGRSTPGEWTWQNVNPGRLVDLHQKTMDLVLAPNVGVPDSIARSWVVVTIQNLEPTFDLNAVVDFICGGQAHPLPQPIALKSDRDQAGALMLTCAYESDSHAQSVQRHHQGQPRKWPGGMKSLVVRISGKPFPNEFSWAQVHQDKARELQATLTRWTDEAWHSLMQAAVPESVTHSWSVLTALFVDKFLTRPKLVELLQGGPGLPLPSPVAVRTTENERGHHLVVAAYEDPDHSRLVQQNRDGVQVFWQGQTRPYALVVRYRGPPTRGEFSWGDVDPSKVRDLHASTVPNVPPSPLIERIELGPVASRSPPRARTSSRSPKSHRSSAPATPQVDPAKFVPEFITRSWTMVNVLKLNKYRDFETHVDFVRGGQPPSLPQPIAITNSETSQGWYVVHAAYESAHDAEVVQRALNGRTVRWRHETKQVIADVCGKPQPNQFKWPSVAKNRRAQLQDQVAPSNGHAILAESRKRPRSPSPSPVHVVSPVAGRPPPAPDSNPIERTNAVPESVTCSWTLVVVLGADPFLGFAEVLDLVRGGRSRPLANPVALKTGQNKSREFEIVAAFEDLQDARKAVQELHDKPVYWGDRGRYLEAFTIERALAGDFTWNMVTRSKLDELQAKANHNSSVNGTASARLERSSSESSKRIRSKSRSLEPGEVREDRRPPLDKHSHISQSITKWWVIISVYNLPADRSHEQLFALLVDGRGYTALAHPLALELRRDRPDSQGRPRDLAHVAYDSENEAREAVSQLDGKLLNDGEKLLVQVANDPRQASWNWKWGDVNPRQENRIRDKADNLRK